MAINKQTIISVFDDKLTLLQWLKTINKALDEAVLTGVEVRQKGNATYSFVVTFEDGTELESNEFVLAQGESINGATIRNGHLYLSLTNGDELDAGNLKPVTSFEINASQHLIVNYGDGTSQDLGTLSDFSNADFVANTLSQNNVNYSKTFNLIGTTDLTIDNIYNRFIEINNILHIIVNCVMTNTSSETKTIGAGYTYIGYTSLSLDNKIASKIFDIEGKSIADASATQDVLVASEPAQVLKQKVLDTNTIFYNARLSLLNRSAENLCAVCIALNGNNNDRITLGPNEKLYLTARMSLSLL